MMGGALSCHEMVIALPVQIVAVRGDEVRGIRR